MKTILHMLSPLNWLGLVLFFSDIFVLCVCFPLTPQTLLEGQWACSQACWTIHLNTEFRSYGNFGVMVTLEKETPKLLIPQQAQRFFFWLGLDMAMGYLKPPLDLRNVNLVLGHMNQGSYIDSQKYIIIMGMNDMSGRQKKVGGASLYFVD